MLTFVKPLLYVCNDFKLYKLLGLPGVNSGKTGSGYSSLDRYHLFAFQRIGDCKNKLKNAVK